MYDNNDIRTVSEQMDVSWEVAERALNMYDGDIIGAMMYLIYGTTFPHLNPPKSKTRSVLKDITNKK